MESNEYMETADHNQRASSLELSVQPYSSEAEEAVLGAILINPEKYLSVAQIISESDFYLHKNRWLWRAYGDVINSNQDLDLMTLSNFLREQDKLEAVGGFNYLMRIANETPSSLHAESYARIVAEKSIRRQLLSSANQISQLAYDEKKDIKNVIDESERALMGVGDRQINKEVQPIEVPLGNVVENLRLLLKSNSDMHGIPTGFYDLDRLLGGMQKSDLIIIAGRPGMGKTGFLLSVLKNVAKDHKKHVAMFSLEMSNEQLAQRLIAQQCGVNSQKLRTGKLQDDEITSIMNAIDLLGDTTIFLDDTPAITPTQLMMKCRRLKQEHHIDLVIVDYLQLMGGDVRNENRVQEVSLISRMLKVMARELEVPVLTAAQLSRNVEQRADKIPVLSDLRESGSLEQDADIVMFLHNPNTGPDASLDYDGMLKLIVAKHRNGPIGEVDLVFVRELTQFRNAARNIPGERKKKFEEENDRGDYR